MDNFVRKQFEAVVIIWWSLSVLTFTTLFSFFSGAVQSSAKLSERISVFYQGCFTFNSEQFQGKIRDSTENNDALAHGFVTHWLMNAKNFIEV